MVRTVKSDGVPNKRIKLARMSVAARRGRIARSLSAVRWGDAGQTSCMGWTPIDRVGRAS
jgi:hypothetical protein